jgi:hypothetical protein
MLGRRVPVARKPNACATRPTARTARSLRQPSSGRSPGHVGTRPGSPPPARVDAGGGTRSRSGSPCSPPFAFLDCFANAESGAEEVQVCFPKMRVLTRTLNCRGPFSKSDLSFSRLFRLRSTRLRRGSGWHRFSFPTAFLVLETTKATHRVALAGRDSDAVALAGVTPVEDCPEVEVVVRRLRHTEGTARGGEDAYMICREVSHDSYLLSPN